MTRRQRCSPSGWLIRGLLLAGPLAHGVVGALAQTPGQLPLLVGTGPGGASYSVPIQTLLFFTALSFLPAVLLMMTGFTRIVIVLSLLRQALGHAVLATQPGHRRSVAVPDRVRHGADAGPGLRGGLSAL
jgi:hypothetical protein